MNFAQTYVNWSVSKWKTVLFSDESKFNLFNSDGKCHVRRKTGERLNPRYCRSTLKHGGGNVMIWTCFSGHGVGPFHQIDITMDRFVYKNILETVMLPYAEWEMPIRWVFQHDNDPKHTSKLVKDWFIANGIQVLDWPAQSPDLNPIENLFAILKRKVGNRRFQNKKDLMDSLKFEWERIPMSTINNLLESMPRRCAEVIKNKGYYTKY